MQVDVIDLAHVLLVRLARSWTRLEKLDVINLTSIGLLPTTVNAIQTFIRGKMCTLSSRTKNNPQGISCGQKDHTTMYHSSQQDLTSTFHFH
jgi:hypothetical protein